MTSEKERSSPLQDQANKEERKAGEERGTIATKLESIRALKEMLPSEAQKIESNGSFYAGTLERAWIYRKLCEWGFITDQTRSAIEEKRRAFHERKEAFSFAQSFREMLPKEQFCIYLLSRALLLAEEGILSQEELEKFGERLRSESREDAEAFLAKKQYEAESDFTKGAFSLFSLCSPYQMKKLLPLHIAFQSLPSRGAPSSYSAYRLRGNEFSAALEATLPNPAFAALEATLPISEEKEKSYLCMKLGILAFRQDRVALLSLADFEDIDSKLAALNTIRRALVLGIIASQDDANALAAGLVYG